MTLISNPMMPTTKTNVGLCNFSGSTKRLKDSIKIEKHNANRKTALISAPSTSARAQPKVFFDHFFGDIYDPKEKKKKLEMNEREKQSDNLPEQKQTQSVERQHRSTCEKNRQSVLSSS